MTWRSSADILQSKTLAYWHISSIFNERLPAGITTEQAISGCNQLLDTTAPFRPLRIAANNLLNDVIRGDVNYVQPNRVLALTKI
jgi:hypothetical protein